MVRLSALLLRALDWVILTTNLTFKKLKQTSLQINFEQDFLQKRHEAAERNSQ